MVTSLLNAVYLFLFFLFNANGPSHRTYKLIYTVKILGTQFTRSISYETKLKTNKMILVRRACPRVNRDTYRQYIDKRSNLSIVLIQNVLPILNKAIRY